MRLLIATKNQGKVKELHEILRASPVELLSLNDLAKDIPEPEETGSTFLENAVLKATYYSKESGLPCIADDSGLAVDALDGRPGVYSARYVPGTDEDRCKKILQELAGATDRRARFVAVIAYADDQRQVVESFEGDCPGEIATSSRGTNGFGYDPIFIPQGYTQTMAELASTVKNTISHRRIALDKFLQWLGRTA